MRIEAPREWAFGEGVSPSPMGDGSPENVMIFELIPTTCSLTPRSFIVLYGDDILLIAPSINELQSLFRNCEKELRCLDMRINAKKSCCLRIGPRFNATCTVVLVLLLQMATVFRG